MGDLSIYQPSNLLFMHEKIQGYQPRGFHPVFLGDTFKEGRYKICHKLGFGGNSTVWLAWDEVLQMWVSIKIKSAESSKGSREIRILQALQQTTAAKHIVTLLDDFVHEGTNGLHQCLVLELLGPSVESITSEYYMVEDQLDPEVAWKIITQLLEAISSLHAVGYTHGDITGSNLAFTCSKLARLPQDKLFEIVGPPEVEELVPLDGKPLAPGVPKQLVI